VTDADDCVCKTDSGTEATVLILGDQNQVNTVSDAIPYGDIKIIVSDDYSFAYDVDWVIITDSWVNSNKSDSLEIVKKIVDSGVAVSVYDCKFDWDKTGLKISYSDDAIINSVCNYENKVKCLIVAYFDTNEAMKQTADWLIEIVNLKNSKLNYVESESYGTEIESFCNYNNSGYGTTAVRTLYYKLNETNQNYDYYSGHFLASMSPDGGSFNSGLDVSSTISSGTLLRYGPHTTQGTTTAGVNVGLTAGTDGVSYTVGPSWTYSIPDVVISDYTAMALNKLDIRHNVDETKLIGHTTFDGEPGKVVKLLSDTRYSGTDTYKSQFCHYVLGHYVQYNDVSVHVNVLI